MNPVAVLTMLGIGAGAGWLAKRVMGGAFGLAGSVIVGIVGALLAGVLLGPIFGGCLVGQIMSATIGAIIFLFVARAVRQRA